MPDIESTHNDRIKALVRLRKRSERVETGAFLVEGERELEAALPSRELLGLYVCEEQLTEHARRVIEQARAAGVAVTTVSVPVIERASMRGNPSGFVAVLRQWRMPLAAIPTDEALVLVVEATEKPGNLGGMLRSANAAGASVILVDPTTDAFNPNVVRASMGTLFTTPVAVASTEDAFGYLDQHSITVFATTPDADRSHYEADLTQPCALVVGGESQGLSDPWLARERVRIPMTGTIDSLNASVSAGIVLFEAVRQRRGAR